MKKKFVILCIILFTLTSFVISAYPDTLKLYLAGKPYDLTQELFDSSIPYLLSRNMIFYHSFKYNALITMIVIPIIVSYNYLNTYANQHDWLFIQRKGLKPYLKTALTTNFRDGLLLSLIPLLWWLILQLLPLTNMIVSENDTVAGLTSFFVNFNNTFLNKELWNHYPIIYILNPMIRLILNVVVYSMLSFAIQIHFKNRPLGMIAPSIIMILFGIITTIMKIDNPFFESCGTTNQVNELVMITYILISVLITIISVYSHYKLRRNNG